MTQQDKPPKKKEISEQLLEVAENYVQAGCYDEAIPIYRTLIDRHPEEDSYVLAMAWTCHDGGRLEEAVEWFEQLLERELSRRIFTGFAFDELARIYKRLERYDRLLDICERALAAQPDDFSLMGDLGEAYMKTGQTEKAVSVFRQMSDMEPEAVVPLCLLGNASIALRDFAAAEAAYERAVAIDPEGGGVYFGRLAEEYRKTGQRERSEAAIRRSINRMATEPAHHIFLGDLLLEDGRIAEGWTAYETAVGLRPDSAGPFFFRLGNTLHRIGRYESAALAFQKAIAMEPANAFYLLHLAQAQAALGREDLAREALRQAESLSPKA